MLRIVPFPLETFFDTYEHRRDLINLASSDVLPWSMREIFDRCPQLASNFKGLTLGYPDVQAVLNHPLEKHCAAPKGFRVLPTSGAAEGIFLLLAALKARLGPAPTLAIPHPAYGAFAGVAALLDFQVQPYHYRPAAGWSLDVNELRRVSGLCDVTVVINPHNPTGTVIDPTLLAEVTSTASKDGRYVLVDEVFRIPAGGASASELPSPAIVIGGLSKVLGFPGLRLGWVVAPDDLFGSLRTIQQYTTLSPNTFAVHAGGAILATLASFDRGAHLCANRAILRNWAQSQGLVTLGPCEGGATAILELGLTLSDDQCFQRLLDEKVLLIPGAQCFGLVSHRPWFRIGYGGAEASLLQGLDAIGRAVSSSA